MTSSYSSYRQLRFSPQRGPLARALAKDAPLRRLDWVIILAALALSLGSSMLVWSATRGATR